MTRLSADVRDLFERCRHRDDPLVISALKVRCTVCKAAPGDDCRHPWTTRHRLGRIVHLCRAQAHMDAGNRSDTPNS